MSIPAQEVVRIRFCVKVPNASQTSTVDAHRSFGRALERKRCPKADGHKPELYETR